MLVKGKLGNLVGGISQQQPQLRLSTQSNDEVNTWPVIVDGNCKRPPTELLGVLPAQLNANAFTHFINRDTDERYAVSISGGAISVVDLNGVAKTVTTPDGTGYLATPGGVLDSDNYTAVTVADYTFIVNKSIITAMTTDVFPVRVPEAIVNVEAGNYGRTYQVSVTPASGPGFSASFTTNYGSTVTDLNTTNTTWIADSLTGQLISHSGGLASGWQFKQPANVIYIANIAGIDFNILGDDSQGGNAMTIIKGQVNDFSKLPANAPNGTDPVFAIVGNTQSPSTTYYVQYTQHSDTEMGSGGTATGGVWKECPQPGVKTTFDAATMPHILVRNSDGTFTFKKAVWNTRLAGDEITCPPPSFIGQAITGTEFHTNRLGFYAGQNVCFSRAGDFFNFWRTSAIELEDDDPIDVNAATNAVAFLRAGTQYQNSLIVWSDQNQFAFSAGTNQLVTPKTVSFTNVTPYENLAKDIKPVATPRRIFFAVDRGNSVGLKEWYYDVYYHIGEADEITEHVPALVPSGAYRMVNSTIESTLVVASHADRSSLWVYKYFWKDQDKLQSAWTRWNFAGATILNHAFINSDLYLLVNRGTQTSLERMRLEPGLTDGVGIPVTYLDRRISAPSGTYNAGTNRTTYTLPYTPDPTNFRAVTRTNGAAQMYHSVPVSVSGSTVTLSGNTTGLSLYMGEAYTTRYVFSPIFMRDASQQEAIQEGKLTLLKMDVAYSGTGYFRGEVSPPDRAGVTYKYEFNPYPSTPLSTTLVPKEGVLTFPVRANSEFTTVALVNDTYLPSRFIRVEWKGNFVPKSRK
jgi:hypothetical protein